MSELDVVTFGEAMAMFIADEVGELHRVASFKRAIAGAETNVAVGLARLGFGVGWVSKVGDDPFGRFIAEALQAEGVNTEHVTVDGRYPTAFQLKSKVEAGDPQVHYVRKGSAASTMSVEDLPAAYLKGARHLHMTGIPPALSLSVRSFAQAALDQVREARGTVSFDPNLRPTLWSSQGEMVAEINRLAFQADWVFPGLAEGRLLTGYELARDIAAFYLEQGTNLVVIKTGPEGAYFRTPTAEGVVPGFVVDQVVDTVGAGDGFAVGVISGLLDGLPLADAVLRGNAIGALAVMSPGDQDGLPTRAQLTHFMDIAKRSA